MNAAQDGERLRALTAAATVSAAVMMAYHVASRATRDTLFFVAHVDIALLPVLHAGTSVLSVFAAVYAARALSSWGPRRVVPLAFLGSAALTASTWAIVVRQPVLGAFAVYLHVGVVSPVLVSGFWSLLNEGFDPRTTRKGIGRIAALATLGGLVGAVLTERLTAWRGIGIVFPALTIAHLWCAWSTWRLPIPRERSRGIEVERDRVSAPQGIRLLLADSHLRNLALIVVGVSISAALIDLLFRAYTGGQSDQELHLMRSFLGLNVAIALGIFAMQLVFARLTPSPDGLVRAIGSLPATLVLGGIVATVFPGLWTVSVLRGAEAVLRGSVFRTGYELLYSALPRAQRRAVRTVIDVGCDRFGEVIGSGITAGVLLLMPIASSAILLALCAIVAATTLLVVLRLRRGHLASLAGLLRDGVRDLDRASLSSLQFAMGGVVAADHDDARGAPHRDGHDDGPGRRSIASAEVECVAAGDAMPGEQSHPGPVATDPVQALSGDVADALRLLRSGEAARVRGALRGGTPLDPALVPQAIRLLAVDDVATAAVDALVAVAGRHVGQLSDALLDPDTEPAARLLIPAVLAACPTPRAIEGLARGLADDQFEVRSRCGRALAHLVDRDSSLGVDPALMFEAVKREAQLAGQAWESLRAFDRAEEPGRSSPLVAFLRDRTERSVEHVFILLALALPGERVQDAFRGLRADDPMLRGAALEYLESVLPPHVLESLSPFL